MDKDKYEGMQKDDIIRELLNIVTEQNKIIAGFYEHFSRPQFIKRHPRTVPIK